MVKKKLVQAIAGVTLTLVLLSVGAGGQAMAAEVDETVDNLQMEEVAAESEESEQQQAAADVEADTDAEADVVESIEEEEELLAVANTITNFSGSYISGSNYINGSYKNIGIQFQWSARIDADNTAFVLYGSDASNGSYSKLATFSKDYRTPYYYDYTVEEANSSGSDITWNFQAKWDGRGNANAASKKYKYYKLEAVSGGSKVNETQPLEMAIAENFFEGDVSRAWNDFKEVVFVDDDGNKLDELVLHEGETQKINLAVKKGGKYQMLHGMKINDGVSANNSYMDDLAMGGMGSIIAFNVDWVVEHNDEYAYSSDYGIPKNYYINGLFTEESITGLSQYIRGEHVNESGNVLVGVRLYNYSNDSIFGNQLVYLPVKVIPNESGARYDAPEELSFNSYANGGIVAEREADVYTMIRKGLVERRLAYAVLGNSLGYDFSLDLDKLYDAYKERYGMKPNEGDYLRYAMGDKEDSYSANGTLSAYLSSSSRFYLQDQYCRVLAVDGYYGAITSAEQEAFVDNKIKQMLSPGGELYSVNNASATDEQKIRAAYNYVVGHVGSTPNSLDRTKPIYHTVYNALSAGHGTCEAYALLFERLVRELGVPCKVMMGVDSAAHAYNIVRNGDYWYFIDTSSGRYLTDCPSFSRAQEQSQFSDQRFINNYLSKLKNSTYKSEASASFTVYIYEGDTLVDEVAIDEINRDGLKECKSVIQGDSAIDSTHSRRYVISLEGGNCVLSEIDMSTLDFSSGNYYKLADRVSIELNGNVLQLNNGANFRIVLSGISNGEITVGDACVLMFYAPSTSGTDIKGVKFTQKAAGGTVFSAEEYVVFEGNVTVDTDCSIDLKSVRVYNGSYISEAPKIRCNIKAEQMVIGAYSEFADITTDILTTLNGYVDDNYVLVNNLTVNKESNIYSDINVAVKSSATLKGKIRYLEPEPEGAIGYIRSSARDKGLALFAARKSDGSYADINISGTLDTRTMHSDIIWDQDTDTYEEKITKGFLTVQLGRGTVSGSTFSPKKISEGAKLATINGITAFPSSDATSASDRISDSNVSKYFGVAAESVSGGVSSVGISGSDICAKFNPNSDAYASLVGSSLNLDGTIGLNLFVRLSDKLASDNMTWLGVYDENMHSVASCSPTRAQKEADGTYRLSVSVPAKNMMDDYTLTVYGRDGLYLEECYSVKDYADYVIEHENQNDQYRKAAKLMKAMLNYGGYAQQYFGYKTDKLANEGLYTPANDPVKSTTINLNDSIVQHFADGYSVKSNSQMSFVGASLVCDSDMGMNFYFNPKSAPLTVSGNSVFNSPVVQGNTWFDQESDGMLCKKVNSIPPSMLDQEIVVSISNKANRSDAVQIYYNPLYYLWKASNQSNEKLTNLAKAIYQYHLAAKEYY